MLATIPENTNFLQVSKFTFLIPELPFAKYFCQNVIMPGVSTSAPVQPTYLSDLYRHGDKLVYDPLTITFYLDEDMRTWEESYIWLITLTQPFRFQQYASRFQKKYYDGVMETTKNSNLPNLRFKFLNCHPTSISSVQFDVTQTADFTPTADITFQYDQMEMERIT
jgi:hypothetical protein